MRFIQFVLAGITFSFLAIQVAYSGPKREPGIKVDNAHDLFYPEFAPSTEEVKNVCPRPVTVAVVDTGVDYTHPDIKSHMWISGDVPLNGLDDDKSGFADDVVGVDFVHDYRLPYDTHGHGTHIAGMILKVASGTHEGWADFALPSMSPCVPNVKIMALKYYDNGGMGYNNLTNTVRAIEYAIKQKADIINYSGGGAEPADSEKNALKKAQRHGILIVAAAGNDGRNNDHHPYYPASYALVNMLSVASINKYQRLLPSSNFGNTVDVAAPGLMLISTLPGGKYGTMSGTSQATAYVSGLAALLMAQSTTTTAESVIAAIVQSSDEMPLNGAHSLLKYGIVNVGNAVKKINEKQSKP